MSGPVPSESLTVAVIDDGADIDRSLLNSVARHLSIMEPGVQATWIWIGRRPPPVIPGIEWQLAVVMGTDYSLGFALNTVTWQARTPRILIVTGGHRFDNPLAMPFCSLAARLMETQPQLGQLLLDVRCLHEAHGVGAMARRDRLTVRSGDPPATAGGRFRIAPSFVSVAALRHAGPFTETQDADQESAWAQRMARRTTVGWSAELIVFERSPVPVAQPLHLDRSAALARTVVEEVLTAAPWQIERTVLRTIPEGTVSLKRVLLVGPWVGEFGWQVCRWQGGVRRLVAECYPEHYVIVVGDAGHGALYEYAHEYWNLPHLTGPLGLVREGERLLPKGRAEAVRRCLVSTLAATLRTGDRPVDHLAPRRFLPQEQRFVRIAPTPEARERVRSLMAERGIERWFCLFPRQRALNPQKNWPSASWSALVEHLRRTRGCGVACMGGVDDTLVLPLNQPWFIDTSRLEGTGLDLDSAFLVGAVGSIGSESGGPFFSLLCGCPTLVLGGPMYADRYLREENPLATPCRYLTSTDFQHPLDQVVRAVDEFFGCEAREEAVSTDLVRLIPAEPRHTMRIAYAGVFTVPHSDNIGHADAIAGLGHTVLRYDFRDRARVLGSHQTMEDELHRFLIEQSVDVVVLSKFEGTHPDVCRRFNEVTRTFLWWPDWERNAGSEIYGHFTNATWASCTGRPVAASIAGKVGRPIWHVFDGADPEVFRPVPADPQYAYDVAFIGQRNPKRELLLEVLERHGYRCGFHGPGFREPVYRDEFSRVCSSAKVVLGINFGDWDGLFFSVRTWMTMACGACFMPEYVNGMEEIFENHRQVAWWRDADDLLGLLDRYVRRDDGTQRKAIGDHGRDLVLRSYTWRDTARRMLAIMNGSIAPVTECVSV